MSKSDCLRVMDIVAGTSVDGPGLRTSVYLAGCAHHCPGCHNPSTWPFDAGQEMTIAEILNRIEEEGFNVTLSGGDPFYQADRLLPLVSELKKKGYNIWCYTGFTLDELRLKNDPATDALLSAIDVLVDGPYIEELHDTALCFRGSSNQNIYDLRKGEIVSQLYDRHNELQI